MATKWPPQTKLEARTGIPTRRALTAPCEQKHQAECERWPLADIRPVFQRHKIIKRAAGRPA